ncbi:MAG: methylenetetrahydrofolate reductase [NAD(P)H] [Acidobacteria bacterium]|nr:MAG: methylenetetrahydrofolate reductase [NAD(P)H] [Acidobacteriota bacterium]
MDFVSNRPCELSFEFFPPRTPEGRASLSAAWHQLADLEPSFFSCTYGAGGSTRDRTLGTVLAIQSAGYRAAPHIACLGLNRADIANMLELYRDNGIDHLVALRGDLVAGVASAGDLRYANELVAFVRETTGTHFRIQVACYPEFHPQACSPQDDLLNFKRKAEAGADSAITQYFFNIDAYLRFVDDCDALGIHLPIVPGIMPIGNFAQLARFSDTCGAEIPRWLRLKMQSFGDDLASIRSLGLDVVTELCDRLLSEGAPGLHFYTMNEAGLAMTICQRLGIGRPCLPLASQMVPA